MKVFNLTDVPTDKLHTAGMLNRPFVVGDALIQPGASREVADTSLNRAAAAKFVEIGIASIDRLPPYYLHQKNRRK